MSASTDDLVRDGWASARVSGPAEARLRELDATGRLDEATPDEIRELLREVGDLRRTWHPLVYRLDLR